MQRTDVGQPLWVERSYTCIHTYIHTHVCREPTWDSHFEWNVPMGTQLLTIAVIDFDTVTEDDLVSNLYIYIRVYVCMHVCIVMDHDTVTEDDLVSNIYMYIHVYMYVYSCIYYCGH